MYYIDRQMISKEKQIEIIKDLADKHNISPYEIGQKTSISQSSAHKIFSGKQKNPKDKTLNIILEYLENAIVGTEAQYEATEKYSKKYLKSTAAATDLSYNTEFSNLKIDDKLNIINEKLNALTEAVSLIIINNDLDKLQQKLHI